jgi:agmatinase
MHETANPLRLRPRSDDAGVAVFGVPLDHNSSFMRGARKGPESIRSQLLCGSMNWTSESGVDLERRDGWSDWGDVDCRGEPEDFQRIEAFAAAAWRAGRLLALGGDHSITAPVLRARPRGGTPLTIVHFDAHPDLYPQLDGNRDSHASPFHRVMEEGLAGRLVQLGIRTMNAVQAEAARRFGVEVVPPDEVAAWPGLDGPGPVYVSFDMDALDPAFAPGVSHHEPGGLTVREVLRALGRVRGPIVGADIVELNPDRDPDGRTAAVGAKLVKELLARLVVAT